ncbi:MAG: hypothetical protein WC006_04615 [Bacilli bacterium]|nr:hypothetical protein [Bacilli bacterium]
MIDEKQIIINSLRLRLRRMCLMFLMIATVNPLILCLMLYILYKLEAEELMYVLIMFAIIIPLQVIIGSLMYRKYKRIYNLNDEDFEETKFYKNTVANIYVKNYEYNGHLIQLVNGLDTTNLLVNGIEIKRFMGPRTRNYKIKAKFNNDLIIVNYKQGISNGEFKLFYNNVKLEEREN